MSDLREKQENTEILAGRKPIKITRKNRPKEIKTTAFSPVSGDIAIRRNDYLIPKENPIENFFGFISDNLYIIGVQVTRMTGKFFCAVKAGVKSMTQAMAHTGSRFFEGVGRWMRDKWRNTKAPFANVSESVQSNRKAAAQQKAATGKTSLKYFGNIIKVIAKSVWQILSTILNYVMPIVAMLILISTVNKEMNVLYVLRVDYKDNKEIGYIRHEKDFGKAFRTVYGRLADDFGDSFVPDVPLYQIVEMPINKAKGEYYEVTGADQLADEIIAASNEDFVPGYGMYTNNVLIGVVLNEKPITDEIKSLQNANKTGNPNEKVQFEKSIALKEGLYPKQSFIEEEALIKILNSEETTDEFYVTQEGDSKQAISVEKGIALSSLDNLNPEIKEREISDLLPVGTSIRISRAHKFLSVKNIYTQTTIEDVEFKTVERIDISYAAGYRKVEKPGTPGKNEVTSEITMVDGVEINKLIINEKRLSDPIEEYVVVGTDDKGAPPPGASGGSNNAAWLWPTTGGFINNGLYGYRGHTGVDIPASSGASLDIRASRDGVVSSVVYGFTGYGQYIEIDHGDGFKTLYAHNSQIYVSKGDYVTQGKIIARMGTTGNSSGVHLHFEIRQNNQVMNPADYISTGFQW